MAVVTPPTNLVVRGMTTSDIPAGQKLAAAAGWNQTASDWTVPLTLEPDGAWVCEMDGDVVGSTTAIRFGRELAWLGLVLVSPRFRRQGIGRALVRHALAWLRQQRVDVVKLDATDLGVPLYESFGFQDECTVERWALARHDPAPIREGTGDPTSLSMTRLDELQDLDRLAFGCGRGLLLQQLAALPGATSACTVNGYVLTRPGAKAAYIGPSAAEDAKAARELIGLAIGGCAGRQIYWDVPGENEAATALAESLGFRMLRRLRRMALRLDERAAMPAPQYEKQFALAGFEYG